MIEHISLILLQLSFWVYPQMRKEMLFFGCIDTIPFVYIDLNNKVVAKKIEDYCTKKYEETNNKKGETNG